MDGTGATGQFGACQFKGGCAEGCQRFKPSTDNHEVCRLCGHDDGFHEERTQRIEVPQVPAHPLYYISPGPPTSTPSPTVAPLGAAPVTGSSEGVVFEHQLDAAITPPPSEEPPTLQEPPREHYPWNHVTFGAARFEHFFDEGYVYEEDFGLEEVASLKTSAAERLLAASAVACVRSVTRANVASARVDEEDLSDEEVVALETLRRWWERHPEDLPRKPSFEKNRQQSVEHAKQGDFTAASKLILINVAVAPRRLVGRVIDEDVRRVAGLMIEKGKWTEVAELVSLVLDKVKCEKIRATRMCLALASAACRSEEEEIAHLVVNRALARIELNPRSQDQRDVVMDTLVRAGLREAEEAMHQMIIAQVARESSEEVMSDVELTRHLELAHQSARNAARNLVAPFNYLSVPDPTLYPDGVEAPSFVSFSPVDTDLCEVSVRCLRALRGAMVRAGASSYAVDSLAIELRDRGKSDPAVIAQIVNRAVSRAQDLIAEGDADHAREFLVFAAEIATDDLQDLVCEATANAGTPRAAKWPTPFPPASGGILASVEPKATEWRERLHAARRRALGDTLSMPTPVEACDPTPMLEVQERFSEDVIAILCDIWKASMDVVGASPPNWDIAMIGMGSVALRHMALYSDADVAWVYSYLGHSTTATPSPSTTRFFMTAVALFKFNMLLLGETSLHAPDFHGFRRGLFVDDNVVFLRTPRECAERASSGTTPVVTMNSLYFSHFLHGSTHAYKRFIAEVWSNGHASMMRSHALTVLLETARGPYHPRPVLSYPTSNEGPFCVKNVLARVPTFALAGLSLGSEVFQALMETSGSSYSRAAPGKALTLPFRANLLVEDHALSPLLAAAMLDAVSVAGRFRMLSHAAHGTEQDKVTAKKCRFPTVYALSQDEHLAIQRVVDDASAPLHGTLCAFCQMVEQVVSTKDSPTWRLKFPPMLDTTRLRHGRVVRLMRRISEPDYLAMAMTDAGVALGGAWQFFDGPKSNKALAQQYDPMRQLRSDVSQWIETKKLGVTRSYGNAFFIGDRDFRAVGRQLEEDLEQLRVFLGVLNKTHLPQDMVDLCAALARIERMFECFQRLSARYEPGQSSGGDAMSEVAMMKGLNLWRERDPVVGAHCGPVLLIPDSVDQEYESVIMQIRDAVSGSTDPFLNKHEGQCRSVLIKASPSLPAHELAVGNLATLLLPDARVPPSEVFCWRGHVIQCTFLDVPEPWVVKDLKKNSWVKLVSTWDRAQFSALYLLHLMIGPYDGRPESFLLAENQRANITQLLPVDSSACLLDMDYPGKELQSVLFHFPLGCEPVHPSIQAAFKAAPMCHLFRLCLL